MLDFDWKYFRLNDINGNWIYLYACPITKLIQVSECLSYLTAIASKTSLTISQLVKAEDDYKLGIKPLIESCLNAHGLNLNQLKLTTLDELFITPGYLYQVNGFTQSPGETKESNKESISLFETEAKMVTRLVDFKLAKNLKQAIAIADSIPHDKLRAYLNARITQLDPEIEKKEKQKEQTKEMMENFAEEFKTGKFFESQKTSILNQDLNLWEI